MDKNKIAVNNFDKSAYAYQDKFMNVDLYREPLDLFCSAVAKENASVLELACGPGNITRYLLQKRPDFKILGTDLAPNMLALAKINNPGAEFQLMDCRNMAMLHEQFDGIMCSFCLPYLSREEATKLIADASALLNPGGAFYLSTMEDDYSKSGFRKSSSGDELYVYFHEADYLADALVENGLTIIDFRHQDFPTSDGSRVTDLVIVATK